MSIVQRKSALQNRTPIGRRVANAATTPNGLVSHYPLSSALVVFGVGLGVGLALGIIIGAPTAPLPSFGQRAGLAAEHFGRQTLGAIAGVLPESLSKHIAS